MFYIIKIKTNQDEYSLESHNKDIIQREMDIYFDSFFGASSEFRENIKKINFKKEYSAENNNINSYQKPNPIQEEYNPLSSLSSKTDSSTYFDQQPPKNDFYEDKNEYKNTAPDIDFNQKKQTTDEISIGNIDKNAHPVSIEGLTITNANLKPENSLYKLDSNEFSSALLNNNTEEMPAKSDLDGFNSNNKLNSEDNQSVDFEQVSKPESANINTNPETEINFNGISQDENNENKLNDFDISNKPDLNFDNSNTQIQENSSSDFSNILDLSTDDTINSANTQVTNDSNSKLYEVEGLNFGELPPTIKQNNNLNIEINTTEENETKEPEASISTGNPELENILNAVKTGIEKTDLNPQAESENLMDMFDPAKNIDISPILSASDTKNSDEQFSKYKESDNTYKKNEAMLEDIFSFKNEEDNQTANDLQSEIEAAIKVSTQESSPINQENVELNLDTIDNMDIVSDNQDNNQQAIKENSKLVGQKDNPQQEQPGVVLDYNLFRAGFIIEEFTDDFLICAYYIKNILHQDCFSMKFINSKLFGATGKIADMAVADELIVKGYIKEYEVEFSKQYAITPDGERYFVAKFQS